MFKQKYPTETSDQALWKQFWHRNQRYHTLCLLCLADQRDHYRKLNALKSTKNLNNNPAVNWGAVMLQDASEIIIKDWYEAAHDNVFGSNGRNRKQFSLDISAILTIVHHMKMYGD